ncbi:hypothetical protein FB451DRAFT_1038834, partial [Mycena latifolia]
TSVNSFGLFRDYPSVPTYNPDEAISIGDLSDIPAASRSNTATLPSAVTPFIPTEAPPEAAAAPNEPSRPETGPFRNSSVLGLMDWMWTGSATKSMDQMVGLVDFLQSDQFKKEDIMDFDVKKETAAFDKHLASPLAVRDGWKEVSVNISVPDGKCHDSESDAPIFAVPGLHYRPLVEVIKSAVQNAAARTFHYTPFKQFWKSSSADDPPQRIFDEIYSSDAMVEAHTTLHKQPPEPGCKLERVVLSLMFWSDSMHLASFGNASLWPLYMFFGNQSKWLRVKPRTNLCHHLPDMFNDWFQKLTGKAPSADVLTHCRRELMHAIWRLLLDNEFLHAYEHGIVIECEDGIFRRFYPRIFTYSADYPEKLIFTPSIRLVLK